MCTAASKSAAYSESPKNSSWSALGTATRSAVEEDAGADPIGRENGSPGSKPSTTESTSPASAQVLAKIDTQSSERQAGSTPEVDTRPRVGLRPTRLLNAAGIRPEPAVSVPSEKLTCDFATETAEPELEPPLMNFSSIELRQVP